MSEYIKREDVLKYCNDLINAEHKTPDEWNYNMERISQTEEIRVYVELMPAADVVERKKGKWELEPEYGWYICSACRDEVTVKSGRTNFCPNCGADLRGEDDV